MKDFPKLSVYYHPVGGLRSKISDIAIRSTSLPYDVIILIETWLNEDFYNAEIFDNNFYNVFRKDRCKEITGMKRGGGVLIATKANFSVNQCILKVNSSAIDIDQVIVKLTLNNKIAKLFVIASYIPPMF